MAGDWIKWVKGLTFKPEIFIISKELNLTNDEVASKFMRLMEWIDDNSENGYVPGVTNVTLDALLGCQGFAAALELSGWAAFDDEGIKFKNFKRYNGQTAKTRALTALRVQKKRSKSNKCNDSSVTESVTTALPEKRREEKSIKSTLKSTLTQKTTSTTKTSQLEAIYAEYPKKVGKQAALKAISQALKRGATADHLTERTKLYAQAVSPLKATEDWQYVPHPATWFNQGRYDDDESNWKRPEKSDDNPARVRYEKSRFANVKIHRATDA